MDDTLNDDDRLRRYTDMRRKFMEELVYEGILEEEVQGKNTFESSGRD